MSADTSRAGRRRASVAAVLATAVLGAGAWIAACNARDPDPARDRGALRQPDVSSTVARPYVAPTVRTPRPSIPPGDAEPEDPAAGPHCGLEVRDMADGRPAAGIAVRVGGRTLTSEADGRLPGAWPGDVAAAAVPDDASWVVADVSCVRGGDVARMYIHRRTRLEAVVRAVPDAAARLDPRRVVLGVAGLRADVAESYGAARLFGRAAFDTEFPRPGSDGRVVAEVPRVRGLLVTATAPGWLGATVELPPPDGAGVVRAEFVLRPAPQLRGRVVDAEGRPVADAVVDAYVLIREPPRDRVLPSELRARFPEGGVTCLTTPTETILRVRRRGTTDADGNFSAALAADGEVHAVVLARGRAVARTALGPSSSLGAPAELTVAEAPRAGRRAAVRAADGAPVGETIGFTDVSKRLPFDPAWTCVVDAKGTVAVEWLEPGTRYLVTLHSRSGAVTGREIVWDDRDEIDLTRSGP